MTIEITKAPYGGTVAAVPSKSHAHRLLICAALADVDTYITCGAESDDIDITSGCLKNLGARLDRDASGFTVKPIAYPMPDGTIKLDCGESGSTLRFMLPVCCALGASAEFIMRGRLPRRPMEPLLGQLAAHGCEIARDADGNLKCSGGLTGGVYEIPGDISSQFISGLLLSLPLINDNSEISVTGKTESGPYIEMTMDALRIFGINIDRANDVYKISGGRRYRSPGVVNVEGDWSNAAFWLCAGAIGGGGITCTGLNLDSGQGDRAVTRLLEEFGANVVFGEHSVTVTPGKLQGIAIDAGDTPDLVPALSAVAAVADGETTIYNAGRLRIKESDRLRAVSETLRTLGADINETRDSLLIKGKGALRGGTVSSFADHRIAMMAAITSIVCENPVIITDAGAVNKSYPGFFTDFEKLGGKTSEI